MWANKSFSRLNEVLVDATEKFSPSVESTKTIVCFRLKHLAVECAICWRCVWITPFRFWYVFGSKPESSVLLPDTQNKANIFCSRVRHARLVWYIYSFSPAALHRFDVAIPKYHSLLFLKLNHFISSGEKFVRHEGRVRRAAWYFVLTLSEGCPSPSLASCSPENFTWEPLLKSNFSESLTADCVRRQRLRR